MKIQGVQGVSIELTTDGKLHYRRKFLFRKDDETIGVNRVSEVILYPAQLGMRAIAEVVLMGSSPRGFMKSLNLPTWCIAVDRGSQRELESFVAEVRSQIASAQLNQPDSRPSALIAFGQPTSAGFATIDADNETADIQSELGLTWNCWIVPAMNPTSFAEHYTRQPVLVHVASHGVAGGLVGESTAGASQMLTDAFLVRLFQNCPNPKLKCVFLNACFSQSTVDSIARHVPVAIGLTNVVEDAVARQFSVAFYRRLLAGQTFATAFAFAQTVATATNPNHAQRYTFVGDDALTL